MRPTTPDDSIRRRSCRKGNIVTTEGKTFNDFGLRPGILKDVAALGFTEPTPVQAKCIPPALEGRDVIGLAQTGTGKTAAFGLPIIQKVAGGADMGALILAPTRELAQQIAAELERLGKSSGLRTAVVVGGIPIAKDHKALAAWPNVLVATPGRLIDHIYSRSIDLSGIRILTVDEADRMYDMGFMPQIRKIIEVLPKERQTLMFTATMPGEVETLVRRHMKNPERVQIGVTAPPDRAEQTLYHVNEHDKTKLLIDLLKKSEGRVLVFVRTRNKVDRLARTLGRRHNTVRLHGNREQTQRDAAMAGFREGKYRILIATDIAARGIDVADIEHVVNYDFPGSAEDYIHRIGRTARVAASGQATSFVTNTDKPCLARLERLIKEKLPLERVGIVTAEPESKHEGRAGGRSGRSRSRSRRGGRRRSSSKR